MGGHGQEGDTLHIVPSGDYKGTLGDSHGDRHDNDESGDGALAMVLRSGPGGARAAGYDLHQYAVCTQIVAITHANNAEYCRHQ